VTFVFGHSECVLHHYPGGADLPWSGSLCHSLWADARAMTSTEGDAVWARLHCPAFATEAAPVLELEPQKVQALAVPSLLLPDLS